MSLRPGAIVATTSVVTARKRSRHFHDGIDFSFVSLPLLLPPSPSSLPLCLSASLFVRGCHSLWKGQRRRCASRAFAQVLAAALRSADQPSTPPPLACTCTAVQRARALPCPRGASSSGCWVGPATTAACGATTCASCECTAWAARHMTHASPRAGLSGCSAPHKSRGNA